MPAVFRRFSWSLVLLTLGLPLAPGAARTPQTEVPHHDASAPSQAPVTLADAASRDFFWPYHVALTQPLSDAPSVPIGMPGVLIRVETDQRALIDFGRDGLHHVPLADTDLVARAETIRLGHTHKEAPNFTYMIGARLIRSDSEKPAQLPFAAAVGHQAFLCLFVPTEGESLEMIMRDLAPLLPHPGLLPILFPLGEATDLSIHARLRAAGQTWAYVHDHLADSYATSLLPKDLTPPTLLLVNNEGRLLHAAPWSASAANELAEQLGKLAPTPAK